MSDLKKAADILRSLPAGDVTRRQFVTTALAAGFAMAVQPVAAGTLTTDDTGLVAGEIQIPLRDGTMPGYRAMPKDGHGFPIVLVVQEIFGVHEHIKDVSGVSASSAISPLHPNFIFAREMCRNFQALTRSGRRWCRRFPTPRYCPIS